jgi:hypothetical protein
VTVSASGENLFEAFRINDEVERGLRIRTIRRVAATKLTVQRPYQMAQDLVAEIRRCRPEWLNPAPDLQMIRAHNRFFSNHWIEVRKDPSYRPPGFASFVTTARSAIGVAVGHQKEIRRHFLSPEHAAGFDRIGLPPLFASLQPLVDELDFADAYWRISAAFTWRSALDGTSQLKDLSDYLSPYLTTISASDWLECWLSAIDANKVPYDRVVGLVQWEQPSQPVTSGNPGDIEHATYLLDFNRFVTADSDFHKVLVSVQQRYYPALRTPALIDPKNADVRGELERALR